MSPCPASTPPPLSRVDKEDPNPNPSSPLTALPCSFSLRSPPSRHGCRACRRRLEPPRTDRRQPSPPPHRPLPAGPRARPGVAPNAAIRVCTVSGRRASVELSVDSGRPEANRCRHRLRLELLSLPAKRIEPGVPQSPSPPSLLRLGSPPSSTSASSSSLLRPRRPRHHLQGEQAHLPNPLALPLSLSLLLPACSAVCRRCHGRRPRSGDHLVSPAAPPDSSLLPLARRAGPIFQFPPELTNW